jgi:hypothetical protein
MDAYIHPGARLNVTLLSAREKLIVYGAVKGQKGCPKHTLLGDKSHVQKRRVVPGDFEEWGREEEGTLFTTPWVPCSKIKSVSHKVSG